MSLNDRANQTGATHLEMRSSTSQASFFNRRQQKSSNQVVRVDMNAAPPKFVTNKFKLAMFSNGGMTEKAKLDHD